MAVRIKSCVASRPGLFENKTLDFGEGINLVCGRNSSGKTLLAKGFLDIINCRPREGNLLDARVWDGFYFDVTCVNSAYEYRYVNNADRYFFIRNQRDDDSEDLLSADPKDGAIVPESRLAHSPAGEALAGHYRAVPAWQLVNASFVPSPADVTGDTMLRAAHLRELFVRDSSGFDKLYGAIAGRFGRDGRGAEVELSGQAGCASLEARIRELDKNVKILEIQESKHDKLQREKGLLLDEIETLKIDLVEHRRKRELFLNILKRLEVLDEHDRQAGEIKAHVAQEKLKREQYLALKRTMEISYPQFQNFSEDQRKNLRKIQEVYRDLRDQREKIDNYNTTVSTIKKYLKNVIIALSISSLAAVALMAGNVLIKVNPGHRFTVVGILLAFICGSALGHLFFTLFSRRSRPYVQMLEKEKELESVIVDLLRDNNISDGEYRIESVYEFLLQYFAEYSDFTDMQLDLVRMEGQFDDEARIEEMKAALQRLNAERKTMERELEAEVYSLNMGPDLKVDINEIRAQIAWVGGEIEELDKKLEMRGSIVLQMEEEAGRAGFNAGEKARLLEERAAHESALAAGRARTAVIRCVRDLMKEAVERRENRQMERLARKAMRHLNALSGNRFVGEIDESVIRSVVAGDSAPALNPAALHAVILSIKLALTDFFIDLGAPLPLIIDDPFLYMDDERARNLKAVLDDISRGRQIIIFTHSSAFKDWGNFIEL